MKYLLDMSQLHPGDIVLEDGESKVASEAIKFATKSKFSHAMIYVGGTLIHAIPKGGVFSKNPQRILKDAENSFKILRAITPLSELDLEKICANARNKVGSIYSAFEAGKSVLPVSSIGENKSQFCSRLVAQSYCEAGVDIVNDVDYCTPEDINRSGALEEIKNCVRIATAADLEMAEREDPNIENQEETLKWLRLARKLLKSKNVDIQTINDVAKHLCEDRSSDKRICKYIESTKYLELYNVDRKLNSYRYCEEELNEHYDNVINEGGLLIADIDLNSGEVLRHKENFERSRENYRKTKLKYFKLQMKLYRNILKECKLRLNVLLKYKRIDSSSIVRINEILDELLVCLK